MLKKTLSIVAFGWAALLGACASTGGGPEEFPAEGPLEPLERPAFEVGYTKEFRDELSGEDQSWEVTQMLPDGGVYAVMSTGCEWEAPGSWFDGSGSYKNCGADGTATGQRELLESTGTLWPLEDGENSDLQVPHNK